MSRQSAAVIVLGFALSASGQCQDKLPVPEYFGFYAVDGGRTVSLYEGQGSSAPTTKEADVYSIAQNTSVLLKLPVVSPSARFILFYSNGGEMVQAMTLHRMPHLRNIVEMPDDIQRMNRQQPRVSATPGKPLFARIPELEFRLLAKPIPNQLQMIELVARPQLTPGPYIIDYGPSGKNGWVVAFAVASPSEEEKPYCLDLFLPGGYGGVFWRANSELAQTAPLLTKERYASCAASAGGSGDGSPRNSGVEAQSPATSALIGEKTSTWDQALKLGNPVSLGVCIERGRSCEVGQLSLSQSEVSLTQSGGDKLFAVPPAQVTAKKIMNNSYVCVFTLQVNGKSFKLQFVPLGVDCGKQSLFVCPPEGVAQQAAVAEYVSRTIPNLASGALGAPPH